MDSLTKAIAHLKEVDPLLREVILTTAGSPPFEQHTNYFQALVGSIISQQLSVKAAATIEKRFIHLFGDAFPSPQDILEYDEDILRSVGLSRPKIRYIKDLALHIIEGKIRFEKFDTLSNDEIIRELTEVKGIGIWTVHMFLMFCMGRLDILPVGDLGIRNGVRKLYELETIPSPEAITEIAANNHWAPYQSIASWYIWQSLDNEPKILADI